MKFVVSGNLRIGKKIEKFTKKVEAKDEADARELTYSLFGSEHGTKRRWINIDKIEKGD
jgi:large subunit ribosomal protein LX